jgi:hypothetical protein
LKLIGPDEVAHNNVAEHRSLNGEPGGDSVLGGAPEAERNLPVTEFPDQSSCVPLLKPSSLRRVVGPSKLIVGSMRLQDATRKAFAGTCLGPF